MSEPADNAVLMTGATGFVGMELLARYVARGDRDVYALVRAGSDAEARERIAATLELVGGSDPGGRVVAVAADIEDEGLGLEGWRRLELSERVSEIVHSAASVSFTLPLEDSRRINVGGTRQMLNFAEEANARGGLERFAYVSTAYVAGTHTGTFREDDFGVGQDFRNAYEQSKFEAERLVRQRADHLPVQIFRPSIIVGEHESGWTASFNVLYSPLKAFARGGLPLLPADPAAPVDVVPVDYVADAIFTLASEPLSEAGETFHLVSGAGATTVASLARCAAADLELQPPPIVAPRLYRRLVHPFLARIGNARRRRALRRSEAFFPYFTMRVRFDDSRARARLSQRGIAAPPVEGYLDRLIDFARAADWGRRRLPRRPRATDELRRPGVS
jgi:thioester reductase-like protein